MRKSREQWLRLVQDWKSSGDSQVQFAERHGVSVATFRYWVARWRVLDGVGQRKVAAVDGARFVAVRTPSSAKIRDASSVGCHVRMGALELWFDEPPPVQWLRALAGLPC
jgi:transposase-like protein